MSKYLIILALIVLSAVVYNTRTTATGAALASQAALKNSRLAYLQANNRCTAYCRAEAHRVSR